jgi:hypothetical protein
MHGDLVVEGSSDGDFLEKGAASLQNALMFSLVHREQLIDGGLVVEQVVRRAAWKYEHAKCYVPQRRYT